MRTLVNDMFTTQGNLGGDKIAMTLDPTATSHILGVLTNLYSDEERACIREYSTNALDSHIAAGQSRPIEVSLPGPFHPFLEIQDFGVGLGRQDLIDVCSKYGASTKRDNDEETGSLGLGSKSALTYAHQFTMTAVKDGVLTQIVVSRNDHGTADMTIVHESVTSEPNGVKVTIPVKRGNLIANKAHEFFYYWKPGTVLVNGKAPKSIFNDSDATNIDGGTNFVLLGRREDVVVMGGIPYPVRNSDTLFAGSGYYKTLSVVSYVDMGSVAFTPNREELIYSNYTVKTLNGIKEYLSVQIPRYISGQLATANTYAEAFKRATKIVTKFGNHVDKSAISWRGKKVDVDAYTRPYYSLSNRGIFKSNNTLYFSTLMDNDSVNNVLLVSECNVDKPASGIIDRVEALNPDIEVAYFFESSIHNHSLVRDLELNHITYADLKKVRVNRARVAKKASAGAYKVINPGTCVVNSVDDLNIADENGNIKPIIFASRAVENLYNLADCLPHCTIVDISANRTNKFKRDWPSAVHFRSYIESMHKNNYDKIPEDEILTLAAQRVRMDHWSAWKDQINDPEFVKWIDAAESGIPNYTKFIFLSRKLGYAHELSSKIDNRVDEYLKKCPIQNYPLVKNVSNRNMENLSHAIKYINMIYKENS